MGYATSREVIGETSISFSKGQQEDAMRFEFKGGATRTGPHQQEKFMLFFLIAGGEVPFYHMKKEGLVSQDGRVVHSFTTNADVVKIFVSKQGFGEPTLFFSFFLKIEETGYPIVSIKPFTDKTDFYFRCKGHFLNKKETLKLLSKGSASWTFARKQEMLPTSTLRKMITIDKSELRKNVRHVILKGGGK